MISIKVPGVSKILGTFSSVCKGPSVCTVDEKELLATFEKRNDATVKVCLLKTGECKKFQSGSIKFKKDDKWCNAVKGVYSVMMRIYGCIPCFDITIGGSLVECDGHILLSAITLVCIEAINQDMKLNLEKKTVISLASEALHIINEDGNLGDIITMLHGKKGEIVFFDGLTQQYKIFDNPFTGTKYSMILLDPHLPVASLKEEVSSKEKEICDANRAFLDMYTGCNILQLSNADFKEMIAPLNEDVRKYCKYLFEESRAAVSVESIIKRKNLYALEGVLTKVRQSYEENLEFICPEVGWVLKRAYENSGCVGACPIFEGWKTRAVVVCKNDTLAELASYVQEYSHIFGFDITFEIIGDYVSSAS